MGIDVRESVYVMRKRERSGLNSTDFVFLISLARQSSVYSFFSIHSRFDFFMCQRPRLDMFTFTARDQERRAGGNICSVRPA